MYFGNVTSYSILRYFSKIACSHFCRAIIGSFFEQSMEKEIYTNVKFIHILSVILIYESVVPFPQVLTVKTEFLSEIWSTTIAKGWLSQKGS